MTADMNWWQRISDKRVLTVSLVVALSQGLNALTDLPKTFLYKDDFHFNPAQVSLMGSLKIFPWVLKPFWGMISDNIPFLGYKRKSYLILFGFVEFLAYMALSTWSYIVALSICMIGLIAFTLAFCNVIGEALLVESTQRYGALPGKTEAEKQSRASQNVSLFFAVKHIGSLLSAYLGGLLLEYITKSEIFKIAGAVPLLVAIVGTTLPESRVSKENNSDVSVDLSMEEEAVDLIAERRQEQEAQVVVKEPSPFVKLWTFVKQPEIYKPLILMFIFHVTPSTGSAMFFFYTNELQFSPEFMGRFKVAGSAAVLLGIFVYNKFLKHHSFQKTLLWSTIICFFLHLTQLILITRANVALGIPDKLFCIGDSIIIHVFGEINAIPLLVLTCRLCPKDMEGTIYAFFLAIFNLGGMISSQLGALFVWLLGINETNFTNLWLLILISSFFLLIPLPWLYAIKFEAAIKKTEEKSGEQEKQEEKEELINEERLMADIEYKEATFISE